MMPDKLIGNYGLQTENIMMMYLHVWDYDTSLLRGLSFSKDQDLALWIGRLFADCLSTAIRRGLTQTYEDRHEWIAGLRGRINISALARQPHRAIGVLPCDFEELSKATLANRVIAKACRELRRALAKEKPQHELIGTLAGLQNRLPAPLPRREKIDFYGLHQAQSSVIYQRLLLLSRLVLEPLHFEKGEDETDSPDAQKSQGTLFEKFLISWFSKRGIANAKAGYGEKRYSWGEEKSTFVPQLRTDIELHFPKQTVILDAKCYKNIFSNNHGAKLHSGNLFQMYAYMSRARIKLNTEVSGGLIYSHTPNLADPLSAPSKVRLGEFDLHLFYLEMDKLPWRKVVEKLEAIATKLEGLGAMSGKMA